MDKVFLSKLSCYLKLSVLPRAQTELDILKSDYLKDKTEPQVISNFIFVRLIKLDERKG